MKVYVPFIPPLKNDAGRIHEEANFTQSRGEITIPKAESARFTLMQYGLLVNSRE
jgi:hypothetical protein